MVPGIRPAIHGYGALEQLGTASVMPVVSRANPWQLLGTLTLEDLLRADGIAEERSPDDTDSLEAARDAHPASRSGSEA